MPWCTPAFSEADGLAWLALCRADQAVLQAHEFGVFDAGTSALLGGAGLNAISDHKRMCNLGYWVRQSAQRQGGRATACRFTVGRWMRPCSPAFLETDALA